MKKAGPSRLDYSASRNSWSTAKIRGGVSNKWNIRFVCVCVCVCSDFYTVIMVMLKYITVLDGARVGISTYIGLVCESCAWTWILLVSKDLRMIKSLDARLSYLLMLKVTSDARVQYQCICFHAIILSLVTFSCRLLKWSCPSSMMAKQTCGV